MNAQLAVTIATTALFVGAPVAILSITTPTPRGLQGWFLTIHAITIGAASYALVARDEFTSWAPALAATALALAVVGTMRTTLLNTLNAGR